MLGFGVAHDFVSQEYQYQNTGWLDTYYYIYIKKNKWKFWPKFLHLYLTTGFGICSFIEMI